MQAANLTKPAKRRMGREEIHKLAVLIPRLGVSRQTIIREIRADRLKARRVRSQWLVAESAVLAYERRIGRAA